MKQIFSSILAYIFDAAENPEYANAAHIKIVKDTDARYPNNLIIVALKALEPFEAIHDDNCECDLCNECEPNCSFCESDKEHYKEMSEFFNEMIEHINFHTFVARCCCCGKPDASYVGLISGKTVFAFCVDCRDELTLKQNAARAASERIGA